MIFELMKLPYGQDELAPYISDETIEYHHGKHLATYVDNINKFIENTEFMNLTLEEIIKKAPPGPIFNNAAQVWNHNFYFEALSPLIDLVPKGELLDQIHAKWGSFDQFKAEFNKMALSNFGSGWTWLTLDQNSGQLNIWNTPNANTPLTSKKEEGILIPLLTCDVWEHAYYIDYRNRRAEYLDNFWRVVNWRLIENRMEMPSEKMS